MALRRTAEFQNDKGIYYKLEIYDSLTGSPSSSTLQLGASGFKLNYESKDRTRFSGVIASNVKFDIIPRDSSEQTVIDDISGAAYGRFQLKILKSSDGTNFNNYWVGNILSDVSSRQNLSFQAGTQQTITATDGLAELVDVSCEPHFLDGSGAELTIAQRFIVTVQKILRDSTILNTSQYFDTNDNFLQTQVNWSTGQMPTPAADKDPLFFSGTFPSAFKKEENNSFDFIDDFTVLDRIMKCWGARLMLSDGMWRVIQPNSYGDTNFERTYRKANAVIITSSAVQLKTNAGVVLGGGTFDSLHPVQKTQMFYDFLHDFNLIQDNIVVWNTFTGVGGDTGTISSTAKNSSTNLFSLSLGNITAQTGANLSWNLYFIPNYFGNATEWDNSDPNPNFGGIPVSSLRTRLLTRLKLVGDSGTTYFLNMTVSPQGVGKEWTTNSTFVGLTSLYIGGFNDYFNNGAVNNLSSVLTISGISVDNQAGTINAIPESGTLSIEGFARFQFHEQGNFSNVDVVTSSMDIFPDGTGGLALGLKKPDGQNYFLQYLVNGESTTKQLVSATQGSAVSNSVLEIEPTNLGSGPTANTATRIITFDAAGAGDDGTNQTWQVFQETTGDGVTGSITKILCKEILSGRKAGVDVYNGSIQTNTSTNYEFHLAFDGISGSKIFVPNEITYNANEAIWDGQWIECNKDISGQTYISQDIVNANATVSNTNN